jgi:hypothetical protein
MHDYDVHEVVYLNFKILVSWARALGRPLLPISENVLNLLLRYSRFLLIQYTFCQKNDIGLTEYWIKHRSNFLGFQTKKI